MCNQNSKQRSKIYSKKQRAMYFCETCKIQCTVRWGSGRFCSSSCAKAFSTKAKRKEINEKISQALLKYPKITVGLCECCKKEFTSTRAKKNCSRKCAAQAQTGRRKKSGNNRKPGSGGLRDGGGRSKVIEYTSAFGEKMKLNRDEIQVAKVLDSSGLRWRRNWTGFPYSETHKFYPDFYIDELDVYIEYKGWLTDEIRKKMKDSNLENLWIVVGEDPRFSKDGISISDLEKRLTDIRASQVDRNRQN